MQPHYEMANTLYHELTANDCCSSTPHISGPLRPIQSGYHDQPHHLQFQQHPQHEQRQREQVHPLLKTHQFCQHPHQFQISQQEQQGADLLGGNEYRVCQGLPHYLGIPSCRQPQEDSTARVSFWKAFNTVFSDAKGKHQRVKENERCLLSENKFGELEAVYILAQNKEANPTGSAFALAGEKKSHTDDSVRVPLGDCLGPSPSVSATATIEIGVDRVSEVVVREEASSVRRARKRIRKTEKEEELGLMTAFFESLVKRMINHQEFLKNKFLEVIERMDKERAEREEAWRRQETEIFDREAISRARERDLASIRESSIVSYIESITGQRFNLASRNTDDQESTMHEQ